MKEEGKDHLTFEYVMPVVLYQLYCQLHVENEYRFVNYIVLLLSLPDTT